MVFEIPSFMYCVKGRKIEIAPTCIKPKIMGGFEFRGVDKAHTYQTRPFGARSDAYVSHNRHLPFWPLLIFSILYILPSFNR